MKSRFLVVDDSREDRDHVAGILARIPTAEVEGVAGGQAAMTALGYRSFDVAVVDYVLGGGWDGLKVLGLMRQQSITMPVILVSGSATVPLAVKAMRVGAFDVLMKPVEGDELIRACKDALQSRRLAAHVKRAWGAVVDRKGTHAVPELVGDSPVMTRARDEIRRYAERSNVPVLIVGETGTGKELIARGLHALSPRAGKPFEAVNCGAIPGALFESELFGYMRGAFTGAGGNKPGILERAAGGTVFMDEVNSLPLEQQAKLLRVLAAGDYQRLGDTFTRKAEVRFLFAMNEDPMNAIREGRLREDLYHRMSRLRIVAPALREHPEDMRAIVAYHAWREAGEQEIPVKTIEEGVFRAAARYEWTGNVRQLTQVLVTALVDSVGSDGVFTEQGFVEAAKKQQVLDLGAAATEVLAGKSNKEVRDMIAVGRNVPDIVWELYKRTGNRREVQKMTGLSEGSVKAILYRKRKKERETGSDDAGETDVDHSVNGEA